MKPGVLAGLLVAVLAVGIGVGLALGGGDQGAPPAPTVAGGPRATPPPRPREVLVPRPRATPAPEATRGEGSGPGSPAGAESVSAGNRPGAWDPGQAIDGRPRVGGPGPDASRGGTEPGAAGPGPAGTGSAAPAGPSGGPGGAGAAPSGPELEARIERRRASFVARTEYQLDIKVRNLSEALGLSVPQEQALRQILVDDMNRRADLNEQSARGSITQAELARGVSASLATGRAELDELLSAEQRERYRQLKPREQILRDDLK